MRDDPASSSAVAMRRSYRKWAFRGMLILGGFHALAAAGLEYLGGEALMMYLALDFPFLDLLHFVPRSVFAWMPGHNFRTLVMGTIAYGVTGAAFGLLLRAYLGWRRHRRGLCAVCGYNLFGNESGRCPECGCAVVRQPKSGA